MAVRGKPDCPNNSIGPEKHVFSSHMCLPGAATKTRVDITDLDSKRASCMQPS